MDEDTNINNRVFELIKLCEAKGVIGISRNIADYHVQFRFSKLKGNDGKGATEKIGGALSDMGDEITKTFAGTI